jgi:hypothetical protein
MKTNIKSYGPCYAILTYNDFETGLKRLRKFKRPLEGGYLIELLPQGRTAKVCEKFYNAGKFIKCDDKTDISDVIRQQLKARKLEEARS